VKRGGWCALFGTALVIAGCQTPTVVPAPPLAADDPRPLRWMQALAGTAKARHSLRATARLAVDSPDLRFRAPQRLLLRRPASLRVEIQGLFGQVAGVLATDGQHFEWLDVSQGRIVRGEVDPGLLGRLARIDLAPAEAVTLLLGVPQPSPGFLQREARGAQGQGIEVIFAAPGGRREVFGFDALGQLRHLQRFDPRGVLAFEARFDAYRQIEGGRFAFEVAFEFPRDDARTSIDFESVELDPSLSDEAFVLQQDRS